MGIRRTAAAATVRCGLGLLDQRIPAAALRTPAKELSGLGPADLTEEDDGGFRHCEL